MLLKRKSGKGNTNTSNTGDRKTQATETHIKTSVSSHGRARLTRPPRRQYPAGPLDAIKCFLARVVMAREQTGYRGKHQRQLRSQQFEFQCLCVYVCFFLLIIFHASSQLRIYLANYVFNIRLEPLLLLVFFFSIKLLRK